jgi:hypothetical protein
VDQRRGQPGAAATKRVTDRNRAAADVQFCVVDAQLALAGEGLRGERLVQLEQVESPRPAREEGRMRRVEIEWRSSKAEVVVLLVRADPEPDDQVT